MAMTLQFIDGTSHYAVADIAQKWNTGSATSMSSTVRHSSGTSIEGPSSLLLNLTSFSEVIISGAFRAPSVAGNQSIFKIRESGTGVDHVELHLVGGVVNVRNGDGTVLGTGSTIVAGDWHYYEFAVLLSATVGTILVHIDGVQDVTANTLDTVNSATLTGDGAMLSSTGNFFSDIYVKTGTGYTSADFFGDTRVDTLYPAGAGADADWTISGSVPAATNHESQDETPADDDVTYVESNTSTERDSYSFDELAPTVANVHVVQVTAQVRKDDTATRGMKLVYRTPTGTYEDGTEEILPSDWTMITRLMETNPNTSAAWTRTEVNAGDFGIILST